MTIHPDDLTVEEVLELRKQQMLVVNSEYQRINALSDFADGASKLYDPIKDEKEARFSDFVKKSPCPWAHQATANNDSSSSRPSIEASSEDDAEVTDAL